MAGAVYPHDVPSSSGDPLPKFSSNAAIIAAVLRAGIVESPDGNGYYQLIRRQMRKNEKPGAAAVMSSIMADVGHFYGRDAKLKAQRVFTWLCKDTDTLGADGRASKVIDSLLLFAGSRDRLTEHADVLCDTLRGLGVEIEEGMELRHTQARDTDSSHTSKQASDARRAAAAKASLEAKASAGVEGEVGTPGFLQRLFGFGAKAKTSAEVSASAAADASYERSSTRSSEDERRSMVSSSRESSIDVSTRLTSSRVTEMLAICAALGVEPATFEGHRNTFEAARELNTAQSAAARADMEAQRGKLDEVAVKLNKFNDMLLNSPDIEDLLVEHLDPLMVDAYQRRVGSGEYIEAFQLLDLSRSSFAKYDSQGQIAGLDDKVLARYNTLQSALMVAAVVGDFVEEYRETDRFIDQMGPLYEMDARDGLDADTPPLGVEHVGKYLRVLGEIPNEDGTGSGVYMLQAVDRHGALEMLMEFSRKRGASERAEPSEDPGLGLRARAIDSVTLVAPRIPALVHAKTNDIFYFDSFDDKHMRYELLPYDRDKAMAPQRLSARMALLQQHADRMLAQTPADEEPSNGLSLAEDDQAITMR